MRTACLLTIAILASALGACSSAPVNPWENFHEPQNGPAEAVGFYSAGCLIGAQSLHPDGPGYHVMHPARRKYYGHPTLIRFIERLGETYRRYELSSVLIGDLGLPRGGPSTTGHRSHQIGLDVDIWFWQPTELDPYGPTLDQRENLSARTMLTSNGAELDRANWSETQVEMLKLAAEAPEVDRIFVNPRIKKALCETRAREPWLVKLRPWWGHDDHFHVRLRCPADSPHCTKQAPPAGPECGPELDWWFTPAARAESEAKPSPFHLPHLPEACAKLLPSGD